MTRLLLVRHGQSEWNARGRWQGQADPPLTELGRRQARAAARGLAEFERVAASDLRRSRDSAEIVAGELGIGPVHVEPELRERHAGEWTGLTRADIDLAWPGFLAADRRPPGYENDRSLQERAVGALRRVAEAIGTAAVISHAGVIYAVEAHCGLPHERIANMGARWVELTGSGVELGDRVELVDEPDVETTVPDQI